MIEDAVSNAAMKARMAEVFARNFAALSTRTPREFAEAVMKMPDTHGAVRPFSFAYAPYQLEPYEAIFDPRNQRVSMRMASRLGKSRIVLTALGFTIVEQPCRIGVMWPVEGDGKLWSKDDFMGELVEPTPEIADLIDDARGQRKSKNTLLHKTFPGGLLQIVGANAPGRLRRMKARFLYADEVDAIQENQSDEGEMLEVFWMRGTEFPDTIQVECSYPSLKGRSRIDKGLDNSDGRRWLVTCLLCGGEPFEMRLEHLQKDENHTATARLLCPRCGGLYDDQARYRMMMGGDPSAPRFDLWTPEREFRGRAGFHANALLWPHPVDPARFPGGFLQVLAEKELEIERSENPERERRVYINTRGAESFQPTANVKPEHTPLFLRREKYEPETEVPAGVLWVGFGCDVQDDRAELEIVGFGENDHTWGLGYHVIPGSPLAPPDQGMWAEIDRITSMAAFRHPSGKVLRVSGGLIDRGHKPDHVLAFTRPRAKRGIYASFGSSQLARPLIRPKPSLLGNPKAKCWELGTHEAKDIIYQRLALNNGAARGFMHYPAIGCYSEKYFKMLTAEDSEDRRGSDGQWYRFFFKADNNVRNEALDIRVMTMAIARVLKPKFARLAEELRVPEGGARPAAAKAEESWQKPVATAPVAKRSFVPRPVRRGNFATSWKR